MKTRSYSHKYIEAVTGKFVVRLVDKTQDAKKTSPVVTISGGFSQDASLDIAGAMDLRDALSSVLKDIKLPKNKETSDATDQS